MGRRSKSKAEYVKLATERNLEFMVNRAPASIRETTRWKCLSCGRIMRKCFSNVKYNPHGCVCHTKSLKIEDYVSLAEKLGLEWNADKKPMNIRGKIKWKSLKDGSVFSASYSEIGYGKIYERYKQYVST